MKSHLYRTVSLSLSILCLLSCHEREEEGAQPVEMPLGFDTTAYVCDSTCVKSGETFGVMMSRLGMEPRDSYRLAQCCPDSVFNVARLIAGKSVEAYYDTPSSDGTVECSCPEYVVYHNSRISSTIFKCRDSLTVWNYSKPVIQEHKYADIRINSSLWNDMIAAGASPALIMDLADIYQWSVNLFTLQ